MKKFEKKVGLVQFTAKDTNKKYPHGYGIPETAVIGDTHEEVEKKAKELEDDEFAVIGVLPIRAYS